jgi:DNA-binding HxlR family transcriptional regulator
VEPLSHPVRVVANSGTVEIDPRTPQDPEVGHDPHVHLGDLVRIGIVAVAVNVLLAGPLRFSEFGERAEGPGDKVLSARLKDLEERGLVLRQVAHGPPVRVTYELTDKGRAFGQVAEAVERWGEKLALDERASPRSKGLREQGTRDALVRGRT